MAKDMVVDAPDRLYPVTLVVLPEGTEPALEEEASPCARGHAFTVGCSVLGKGDGKVVLTSFAEGEELMGGVRSALAWARLHCSALARVFRGRQELTNLRRTDLDYWMDFGLEYITKTGASLGVAAACSFVTMVYDIGVGVERCVAMTGVVSPSGAVRSVGGIEAKLSYAEQEERYKLVVLPEANAEEARALVEKHGWSIKLLPVSHMGQVLTHLQLRSVKDGVLSDDAAVAAAAPSLPPALGLREAVDHALVCTVTWVPLDDGKVAFPETECAVLPGAGRYTCRAGLPEAKDQADKVWKSVRETCQALQTWPRNPLVRDLESSAWDVHVDVEMHRVRTMEVGLSIFCGLLAAALGRTIEPSTFFSGAMSVRGRVMSITDLQGVHVVALVRRGCRRLLVSDPSVGPVEAVRRQLLATGAEEGGGAAVVDAEVRGLLEALEVVGVPEMVQDTRQVCEAIWPELKGATLVKADRVAA